MEIHEIEVAIDTAGKVLIKVRGMSGDACLATTAELERLLGNAIESRERTDGFEGGVSLPQANTLKNTT